MPSINGKAYEMAIQISLDVLTLKVGEEKIFNFKDNPMTIKRVD